MTNDLPDWATVVARPDTVLAGSPVAYASGTTNKTFVMPTGVHILSIVLPNPSSVTSLAVTGSSSFAQYFQDFPSQNEFQSQYYILIPEGADTSVNVNIIASASGSAYLTGMSDPVAAAALPQNPAPWQAPNQPPMKVSFANPGQNNSSIIIVAPPAGRSLWLHGFYWEWTATNGGVFGNWSDSSGLVLGSDTAAASAAARYMDWRGAKITAQSAFEFVQTGAAAANTSSCLGSITYSIY